MKIRKADICIALAVVCVLAIGVWEILPEGGGEEARPQRSDVRVRHKALAKPAPAIEAPAAEESGTVQDTAADADEPARRYENGVEVVSCAVTTNSSGAVIERLVLADGRKMKKVHPPKPVFDNPADQLIALAISAKPGESMPPFPDMSGIDRDFERAVMAPIEINDDDTDEVKALKAKVMEVRAYLIEEVRSGGSVIDALEAHKSEMDRIADSHAMAVQEVQKLISEGDIEGAREFAENVNAAFEVQGIPPIKVPGGGR